MKKRFVLTLFLLLSSILFMIIGCSPTNNSKGANDKDLDQIPESTQTPAPLPTESDNDVGTLLENETIADEEPAYDEMLPELEQEIIPSLENETVVDESSAYDEEMSELDLLLQPTFLDMADVVIEAYRDGILIYDLETESEEIQEKYSNVIGQITELHNFPRGTNDATARLASIAIHFFERFGNTVVLVEDVTFSRTHWFLHVFSADLLLIRNYNEQITTPPIMGALPREMYLHYDINYPFPILETIEYSGMGNGMHLISALKDDRLELFEILSLKGWHETIWDERRGDYIDYSLLPEGVIFDCNYEDWRRDVDFYDINNDGFVDVVASGNFVLRAHMDYTKEVLLSEYTRDVLLYNERTGKYEYCESFSAQSPLRNLWIGDGIGIYMPARMHRNTYDANCPCALQRRGNKAYF